MDKLEYRVTVLFISALASLPLTFFAVWCTWNTIDSFLARREVDAFLVNYSSLVETRLSDPKVYAFSIGRSPEHSGRLLITYDVEDAATYRQLESDLDMSWQMRFPAQWKTNVRSGEDLGNDFGFAARGFGELAESLVVFWTAVFLSVSVCGLVIWRSVRRINRLPVKDYSKPCRNP